MIRVYTVNILTIGTGRSEQAMQTQVRPFPGKQSNQGLYRHCYIANISNVYANKSQWWSAGAMVLGKLPVPGRPTIWIRVGQGPTALAVGAGGVVWTFLLSTILSLLLLPLFGRRPDID